MTLQAQINMTINIPIKNYVVHYDAVDDFDRSVSQSLTLDLMDDATIDSYRELVNTPVESIKIIDVDTNTVYYESVNEIHWEKVYEATSTIEFGDPDFGTATYRKNVLVIH